MPTRRTFTRAAALAPLATAVSYRNILGANDRVRLGWIGVGNRGDQLLDAFLPHPDAEVVAIADAYEPYLAPAKSKAGGKARTGKDYRALLDSKDIDAVVIATPDHWHALQFVDACRAGKHVYVEKPASLTIGEGRVMCRVAEETHRVTQVGLHRRSAKFVQEAVEALKSGAIGKISFARCYHLRNEAPMGIGRPADGEPPAGLDWDLWLGPAPKAAFNTNKALYKFRWFNDYSGGQLTNMGTHYLDIIQWGLGHDAPLRIASLGGNYVVNDNRDIPDTMETVWEYPGCLVTFTQINGNGAVANARGWDMEFRGTHGTLLIGPSSYEIIPESIRTKELPALSPIAREANSQDGRAVKPARAGVVVKGNADTTHHARNFLDAIKGTAKANCPIETGHRSTTATLLGKLALMRRQILEWDAKTERVTNDQQANKLLTYEYRRPWKLA